MSDHAIIELNQQLAQLQIDLEASEAEGVMIGLICAGGVGTAQQWLDREYPVTAGDLLAREARAALLGRIEGWRDALTGGELGFQPLLPDDESAPLTTRVEALAQWCQGLLLGLSEAGLSQRDPLPDDVTELLGEIASIAGSDGFEIDEQEAEDHQAYQELLEFVRVGTLLLHDLLRAPPLTLSLSSPPTTHH